MKTLWIVITLSHLRALHDALRKTFLKVTNIWTASKPVLGARWFQISVTCVKERVVGGDKKNREGGRGDKIVILSTSSSSQIPNHKTSNKKKTT